MQDACGRKGLIFNCVFLIALAHQIAAAAAADGAVPDDQMITSDFGFFCLDGDINI